MSLGALFFYNHFFFNETGFVAKENYLLIVNSISRKCLVRGFCPDRDKMFIVTQNIPPKMYHRDIMFMRKNHPIGDLRFQIFSFILRCAPAADVGLIRKTVTHPASREGTTLAFLKIPTFFVGGWVLSAFFHSSLSRESGCWVYKKECTIFPQRKKITERRAKP